MVLMHYRAIQDPEKEGNLEGKHKDLLLGTCAWRTQIRMFKKDQTKEHLYQLVKVLIANSNYYEFVLITTFRLDFGLQIHGRNRAALSSRLSFALELKEDPSIRCELWSWTHLVLSLGRRLVFSPLLSLLVLGSCLVLFVLWQGDIYWTRNVCSSTKLPWIFVELSKY